MEPSPQGIPAFPPVLVASTEPAVLLLRYYQLASAFCSKPHRVCNATLARLKSCRGPSLLVSGLPLTGCFGGLFSPPGPRSLSFRPAGSHASFCSVRPGAIAQTTGSSLRAGGPARRSSSSCLFFECADCLHHHHPLLLCFWFLLTLPRTGRSTGLLGPFLYFFCSSSPRPSSEAARWTKPASRLPRKERGVAIRTWIRTSSRCLFLPFSSGLSHLALFPPSAPGFARLSRPLLCLDTTPDRPAICAARTIATYPLSSPPSRAIAEARRRDCQRGIGTDPHICCAWLTLPRICSSSASVPLNHRHVIVVVVAESGRRDHHVCPLLMYIILLSLHLPLHLRLSFPLA